MSRHTVSVVIPCHNYGRFLAEAIESARRQTHVPVEIIVVDDGSTDDTHAIATAYGREIRYLRQANAGPSAARNAGLRLVRGDYLLFLDADDVLEPEYIKATLSVFTEARKPRLGFVYSTMRMFGRESDVTHVPDHDLDKLLVGNYAHATALLRTDAARQAGYDERLRQWEDWDFYLTMCGHGWTGQLLDEPLLRYRKHEDRVSLIDNLQIREQRRLYALLAWKHRRLYRRKRVLMWRRILVGRAYLPLLSGLHALRRRSECNRARTPAP